MSPGFWGGFCGVVAPLKGMKWGRLRHSKKERGGSEVGGRWLPSILHFESPGRHDSNSSQIGHGKGWQCARGRSRKGCRWFRWARRKGLSTRSVLDVFQSEGLSKLAGGWGGSEWEKRLEGSLLGRGGYWRGQT